MPEEININRIDWQAAEYKHKERNADWFWTIGLIAILMCIGAIWFKNYVFAIFILISGGSLIMFTLRTPQILGFTIDKDGLSIGKELHPWQKIKGFNIKNSETEPKLLIQTSRHFLPIYTIPLPSNLVNDVRDALLQIIPEVEIEESRSMLFMEKIGF